MRDQQFERIGFKISEVEHKYGPDVHILSNPFLLSHLAQLCADGTKQPTINELVNTIYLSLLQTVVNREFSVKSTRLPTRMAKTEPNNGYYEGPVIDPEVPVVTVNLARAGTLPSHICYTALNYFMNPDQVRQDHISIGRTTDAAEKVTGSRIAGHKVGGGIDGAMVLFPDPMGATGSTLVEAVDFYKTQGKARKFVALHCIITPEYIKRVREKHPDLVIYAVRLDRGLSSDEVLKSIPGTYWDREKGLNSKQYIVPGGGGFGEIMNNAYV